MTHVIAKNLPHLSIVSPAMCKIQKDSRLKDLLTIGVQQRFISQSIYRHEVATTSNLEYICLYPVENLNMKTHHTYSSLRQSSLYRICGSFSSST